MAKIPALQKLTHMSTEMNNLAFLRKCQAFLSVFWLKMLDLRDMCCVINIIYSHDSLAFTVQMSIRMVLFF